MSSLSQADFRCQHGDTICGKSRSAVSVVTKQTDVTAAIRVYEQEVIVVPILLLAAFLVTIVFILLLHFCPEKVDRIRPQALNPATRRGLQGIDAPPGINVLEHESIALEVPMSYATFHPPDNYISRNLAAAPAAPPSPPPNFTPIVQPRELPRQRLPESFNLVNPLPTAFSLPSDSPVSLYRARMDNRNVVLRVLNDSADATQRHSFLNFASFLAQLGPHPFLPELLGVVSLRAPLVTVIEELENRDLLSFLWRCREERVNPPCEMTERRMFIMAKQVASALEFLHSKGLLHGHVCARSVLVSREFTAKLWGLHGVYTRKSQGAARRDDASVKKWQAPEILAKRPAGPSSDIWSFGILLFEMATMGEAPFAEIPTTELLQFHQRGKTLRRPANCSNTLYSVIKTCCQFKDQDRPSMVELGRRLLSGEKGASDKVIKVSEKINIEHYLQEAGYGEANSYTVF
uniref:Serine/threonine/tyrosine kinase 1b n=1 Tax=Tetraodon nigroviridis TaxID=99883 RepID=H3CRJ2_TETNG